MSNGTRNTASLRDVREYAQKRGMSLVEAEMALLDEGVAPLRYLGTVNFLGCEGQKKLLASKALVLGLGGLGGTLCELLARLGVGRLVLIDSDKFDEVNLNRQLLCRESDIGRYKADCARERVLSVNSALDVQSCVLRANEGNIGPLLDGCDIALDALDNGETRIMLEEACCKRGIPLIHGALGNASFQISTITDGKRLLHNLYARSAEAATGTPVPSVVACAALQVAEVIKVLTGIGKALENELLYCDWLNNAYETISFV